MQLNEIVTYHTPPTASRASNTTGFHIPALYSGESIITLRAVSPAAPAPIIHICLTSGNPSKSRSDSNRISDKPFENYAVRDSISAPAYLAIPCDVPVSYGA